MMTNPIQRARSLRLAHEVLSALEARRDVPADLKNYATAALRHYPKPQDVGYLARLPALTWWLQAEPEAGASNDASADSGNSATQKSIWTVSSRHLDTEGMGSTLVVICSAESECAARQVFAARFGEQHAHEAKAMPGIVVDEVTNNTIAPHAEESMRRMAARQAEFSFQARLDYDFPLSRR
jgi:hypothetical protein